ncbi:kinase-like domain-containing protein [Hypoxylon crocopeplum]|nr:kinase-like domain-containing protein [Hypoxylon crocopeplum]
MTEHPPEVNVTNADGETMQIPIRGYPLSSIPEPPLSMRDLDSYDHLDNLLRENLNEHMDGKYKDFLTPHCLRTLLPAERVRRHLRRLYEDAIQADYKPLNKNTNYYLELICPRNQFTDDSIDAGHNTYIRLFATLVLIDKGLDVFRFIDEGISDEKLPATEHSIACTREWGRHRDRDEFYIWQWKTSIPFLAYGEHKVFDAQVVLPFLKSSTMRSNSLHSGQLGRKTHITPITEAGGYGEVSYVEIHPQRHDFNKFFRSLPKQEGPFALKKLFGTDPTQIEDGFKKEVRMLKKFDGKVHPHIVTILTTFQYGNHYYLLFPWAECDLGRYFERIRNPIRGLERVRWLSEQCFKIMEAIHLIHNPPDLNTLKPDKKLFGRHGDIKAENILVFRSQKGKENLVLSDFGQGSVHHDWSKSNIPNKKISTTPGFRPPECDMEDGRISRAFDVWTLGCLFLDLLTWLLGGEDFRQQFENERMTCYITGLNAPIYFEVVVTEQGEHGYIVKEEVKRWFGKMHRHPHCTQFVHEFLDLVERKMLIVETNVRKRERSGELLEHLRNFNNLCQKDGAETYCLDSVPYDTPLIVRASTIAEGPLNETARDNIIRSRTTLRSVNGPTQRAEPTRDEN